MSVIRVQDEDYISLTDMLKAKDGEFFFSNWLRNRNTAEFLGFKPDDSFSERDLESSIITHLRDFMMELGRGFAFVARQQHIRTDAEDYFIDLVFYNVVLKCYVLVDLKVGKITHQDVRERRHPVAVSGSGV